MSKEENLRLVERQLEARIVHETSIIDDEFVTGIKTLPDGLHSTVTYGFRDGLIDRVWFAR